MQYEIGVEYGKIGIGRYIQRNKKTIYTITKACFFFFLLGNGKDCLGSGKNESEKEWWCSPFKAMVRLGNKKRNRAELRLSVVVVIEINGEVGDRERKIVQDWTGGTKEGG